MAGSVISWADGHAARLGPLEVLWRALLAAAAAATLAGGILQARGWPNRSAQLVTLAWALMLPGAVLGYLSRLRPQPAAALPTDHTDIPGEIGE